MAQKDKDQNRVVYSTNPDFQFENEEAEIVSPEASKQTLYIRLDRLKGNKLATVIEGFKGNAKDLEDLGKELKKKCGCGGSVKDMEVILQGDFREKAISYLHDLGYKTKRKGS